MLMACAMERNFFLDKERFIAQKFKQYIRSLHCQNAPVWDTPKRYKSAYKNIVSHPKRSHEAKSYDYVATHVG
jgi:hypothetical protein